jgi:hypothetical protein
MGKIHDQLRGIVDGNDSFMTGFQIGKPKQYRRKVPVWLNNNKQIQVILLSAFPKLGTDQRQRTMAARWANVVHYYFRLRYTDAQTAEELGIKVETVKNVLNRIRRAAGGRKANGSGARGGKYGRPKKVVTLNDLTIGRGL